MKKQLRSVVKITVFIVVPHNLTSKFQPLGTTFNKPANSFIKDKYNIWYTEQVIKQLNEGKDSADVEVSLNLSQVKPLHAKWIFEMYKYLQGYTDLIINSFKATGITEVVEKANETFHCHFSYVGNWELVKSIVGKI